MAAKREPEFEPPEHLDDATREVWESVVAAGKLAPNVSPELLEAYCGIVVRHRDASRRIAEEGLVVDGGEKRGAVVHPALAAERALAAQLRQWAPMFNQPPAVRKRGPMVNATRASIKAAGLDAKHEFEGACAAVLTLAWLIDEAQRAGIEALQRASSVTIPSYLKGCADLQITPATLPAEKGKTKSGKVNKYQRGARSRASLAIVEGA